MTAHSAQRIAERRVIFGTLAEAWPVLALAAPVALLGTRRSLAAIPPARRVR